MYINPGVMLHCFELVFAIIATSLEAAAYFHDSRWNNLFLRMKLGICDLMTDLVVRKIEGFSNVSTGAVNELQHHEALAVLRQKPEEKAFLFLIGLLISFLGIHLVLSCILERTTLRIYWNVVLQGCGIFAFSLCGIIVGIVSSRISESYDIIYSNNSACAIIFYCEFESRMDKLNLKASDIAQAAAVEQLLFENRFCQRHGIRFSVAILSFVCALFCYINISYTIYLNENSADEDEKRSSKVSDVLLPTPTSDDISLKRDFQMQLYQSLMLSVE